MTTEIRTVSRPPFQTRAVGAAAGANQAGPNGIVFLVVGFSTMKRRKLSDWQRSGFLFARIQFVARDNSAYVNMLNFRSPQGLVLIFVNVTKKSFDSYSSTC